MRVHTGPRFIVSSGGLLWGIESAQDSVSGETVHCPCFILSISLTVNITVSVFIAVHSDHGGLAGHGHCQWCLRAVTVYNTTRYNTTLLSVGIQQLAIWLVRHIKTLNKYYDMIVSESDG